MIINEIIAIKAALLCYGVRLDEKARKAGMITNPYLFDAGFVHAAHFLIDGVIINTCVSEKFCKRSSYVISYENDKFILNKNNKVVCPIEILPLPDWCMEQIDGYIIADYLRPHSLNCISCFPKLDCMQYENGMQCKFCSLCSHSHDRKFSATLPAVTVAKMIGRAIQENPYYEIALSGGTCDSDDKSALYFSEICELLTDKRKSKRDISVELAPPDKNEYIKKLHDAGATALIMNIEIADDSLRKIICPGKSSISLDRYFNAMQVAVSAFGRGKVSCVLIAGIQPEGNIVDLCKQLISMGVIPTIIPFKPLDDCQMSGHPVADANEILRIAKIVNELLKKENLTTGNQGGCTKCGGCSLESLYQSRHDDEGGEL